MSQLIILSPFLLSLSLYLCMLLSPQVKNFSLVVFQDRNRKSHTFFWSPYLFSGTHPTTTIIIIIIITSVIRKSVIVVVVVHTWFVVVVVVDWITTTTTDLLSLLVCFSLASCVCLFVYRHQHQQHQYI